MTREHFETVIGCDFGASARAGAQAKKIILIEALRRERADYRIAADGRNCRLVRTLAGSDWRDRRRGWTVVELATSLFDDSRMRVIAFDFPFSIPIELLHDEKFASLVGQPEFRTRNRWMRFIARNLPLDFDSDLAGGRLTRLADFDAWKSQRFWMKRATDVVARSQPSLKHLYQSTFAMTLVGNALLARLAKGDLKAVLTPSSFDNSRCAIEAYPGAAARQIGFAGAYKQSPVRLIRTGLEWLQGHGIEVDFDHRVRRFCETYSSGPSDYDGADAFLCLVSAIAFREGLGTFLAGDATASTLRQEGCIVVPQKSTCNAATT